VIDRLIWHAALVRLDRREGPEFAVHGVEVAAAHRYRLFTHWKSGNISAGGEHVHHYMWGIGLLSGVGAVAVRGEERHRRHPVVAVGPSGCLLGHAGPDLG
jgi:hypothetical protein